MDGLERDPGDDPIDDRAEREADRWATGLLGGEPSAPWDATRARLAAAAADASVVDIAFEEHDAPVGRLLIGATEGGVVRVALPTEDADALLETLAAKVSPRILRAPRAALTQARHELDEYFTGRRHTFDVPLDWALISGFRRGVLGATALIPYGATASYGDVAAVAGSPRAVRAAGTALAGNPLPILIPCHRVLRADGALGQYLGGPPMKQQLLHLEGAA